METERHTHGNICKCGWKNKDKERQIANV
jgi:hypothetical protein